MNKNVFFVTNNCMKTREEYLEKFKKLKIQAEVSQVTENTDYPNSNGSVLKNPEISGALYTLRIQYKYTQIQCEDGARDFRVL